MNSSFLVQLVKRQTKSYGFFVECLFWATDRRTTNLPIDCITAKVILTSLNHSERTCVLSDHCHLFCAFATKCSVSGALLGNGKVAVNHRIVWVFRYYCAGLLLH